MGSDEIRVIACGTGMPTARRAEAAAAWVVELGNGDKFIVDIGSGSMTNIQSLMIPAILRTNQLVQTNIGCKIRTLERNEGACIW